MSTPTGVVCRQLVACGGQLIDLTNGRPTADPLGTGRLGVGLFVIEAIVVGGLRGSERKPERQRMPSVVKGGNIECFCSKDSFVAEL